MSEIRLIVRDARREICGTRHGSFGDAVIGALAAEPETIEELDTALERFIRASEWSNFRGFHSGANDEPYDAGLLIVDLAGRLIVCESTYSSPSLKGAVAYHNGKYATEVYVQYRLPDDWRITSQVEGWRSLAERRRRERAANPPLDARAVLYGRPLVEFLVAECQTAATGLSPRGSAADDVDERDRDIVRGVHARWLLTPRDDLRGLAPRDVLLAKRDLVSWDMQCRCEQWSELDECPRGLDPESHAFRFGGFGTHELVEYYDLVRNLVWEGWIWARGLACVPAPAEMVDAEIASLERLREHWLDAPDPECHGLTPREIIDHERARIPEGMSGREAMVDHDCPTCQMMADMPGPMFWHLDGCNMDQEFAFSFHRTQAEWDEEQREYEEFNRRFEAEQKEREALGIKYPDGNSPWQRSFVSEDSDGLPLSIRLYQVGMLLSELTVDLKEPAEDRPLIDRLHREFGNVREVAQANDAAHADALLQPVLERVSETLGAVVTTRPDLSAKCEDLKRRLRRFLEPEGQERSPHDSSDDEMPF